MSYRVFVRSWWRNNPAYPNGLEPYPGRKTTLRARSQGFADLLTQ